MVVLLIIGIMIIFFMNMVIFVIIMIFIVMIIRLRFDGRFRMSNPRRALESLDKHEPVRGVCSEAIRQLVQDEAVHGPDAIELVAEFVLPDGQVPVAARLAEQHVDGERLGQKEVGGFDGGVLLGLLDQVGLDQLLVGEQDVVGRVLEARLDEALEDLDRLGKVLGRVVSRSPHWVSFWRAVEYRRFL